jgi:anti-anti-sigma factor
VTVLALTGAIDASTLPAAAAEIDALVRGGSTRLVLNLQGVEFAGGAALEYVTGLRARLRAQGGDLVLSEPGRLGGTIRALGLDQLFRVFPDDEAAVEHFAALGGPGGPGDASPGR